MSDNGAQEKQKAAKVRRKPEYESVLQPIFAAARHSVNGTLWGRNQQKRGLLQRRCACGTHTIGGGECDTCRRNRETDFLQRTAITEVHNNNSLDDPAEPHTFPKSGFTYNFSQIPAHTTASQPKSNQGSIQMIEQTSTPGKLSTKLKQNLVFIQRQNTDEHEGSDQGVEPNEISERLETIGLSADGRKKRDSHTQSDLSNSFKIQRWPWSDNRTDQQLIADAIRNRSVSDAKAIEDVDVASEPQKIELIDILAHQGWVGPNDETQIENLWDSFDHDLPRVAEENIILFRHCLSVGAALWSIPTVQYLRADFRRDVRITAVGYLAQNRTIVSQEMEQLGIAEEEGEVDQPITDEQEDQINRMQQAAQIVAQLQRGQENLRRIRVGYVMVTGGYTEHSLPVPIPVRFDPLEPPQIPARAEDENMQPWETVKAEYERANAVIAALTDLYPALYAISREGESTNTQRFADASTPTAARTQLSPALRRLMSHIIDAQTKLREEDIDPLDLLPIHEQLFAGQATASGTDWSSRLPRWAADQEKRSHQSTEFWTQLGLTSLSAAAFILAPFTGGASMLVMLVGLGIAGAQAVMSAERYEALASAARTEVQSGTALVTPEQVSIAEQQMIADQVALAMAALLVAGGVVSRGVSAIRQALGGRNPSLQVLMGEARYAEYAEAIEAIKANHPELANIPIDDLIAIRGYTAEDYAQLNLALRRGDPEQLARLQTQIQNATSGLRQLPAHRGTVHRAVSLSDDMAARYRPGRVVAEPSFTSASMPGGTYQRGGNTLMIIESSTGRDVSLVARHLTEREILFAPGTRFRVVSVEADGHIIRLVDLGL
ncbi:MAG TPA: ADP-ribosyltransferase [Cyclobacteriaceae bacterium]|nr:ADP-ribosyltransferase [Cyclobacteriaceae bacterium]